MKHVAMVVAVVLGGCSSAESTPGSVGLAYTESTQDVVAGTFETAYGTVAFRSAVVADGVVDVTFTRGAVTFGSHVDWTALSNDLQYAPGYRITDDDRFLLQGLAAALENDLGRDLVAGDNLIRQATLWGHHPAGPVLATRIVADAERSWTTLCNVTAYTFSHDAASHGLVSEYLAAGRYETSNPCRDRCGPGCSGVGTSAWTRDCGNHDRCEQLHASSDCMDEFASASDDFSFAPNCKY